MSKNISVETAKEMVGSKFEIGMANSLFLSSVLDGQVMVMKFLHLRRLRII